MDRNELSNDRRILHPALHLTLIELVHFKQFSYPHCLKSKNAELKTNRLKMWGVILINQIIISTLLVKKTNAKNKNNWEFREGTYNILTEVVLKPARAPFVLFQSLLNGLMCSKPEDPVEYLESCLQKVKELGGCDKVKWDTFVSPEKKTLPPLNGGQSRRSFLRSGNVYAE